MILILQIKKAIIINTPFETYLLVYICPSAWLLLERENQCRCRHHVSSPRCKPQRATETYSLPENSHQSCRCASAGRQDIHRFAVGLCRPLLGWPCRYLLLLVDRKHPTAFLKWNESIHRFDARWRARINVYFFSKCLFFLLPRSSPLTAAVAFLILRR